jgi:hypothetical protein
MGAVSRGHQPGRQLTAPPWPPCSRALGLAPLCVSAMPSCLPAFRRCMELERQLKALQRKKSFYEPEVRARGGWAEPWPSRHGPLPGSGGLP